MKKTIIIFTLVTIHFSICMGQIACKTVYDRDCSSLKTTIVNLHENSPVILQSDNNQAMQKEIIQSFSNERINASVDRSKLLDITLYYYDDKNEKQKTVNIRVSDKVLQETPIAPLDSVTTTIYCLGREERSKIHKIEVWIYIPYSTVDGKIIEGLYSPIEYIYLPSSEE